MSRPDLDLYRRFEDAGVTDIVCAPWMVVKVDPADARREAQLRPGSPRSARFADEIMAKL